MRVIKFICSVAALGVTVSSSPTKWVAHQRFEERSSDTSTDVRSEIEARANPQLRIMVAGASIASGYQSSDGNGFRLGLEEAVVAAGNDVQMLGTVRTGTMKDNAYEAKGGLRIDEVMGRIDAALPQISPSPNIILVQVGANDLGQNFKVDQMAERMTTLIDHVYNADPDVNLIISTLLPSDNTEAGVLTFNGQLRGVVDAQTKQGRHVWLADVHSSDFSLADIRPKPDGTHPTDAGYAKMAKVYAGVVLDIVKTRFAPPHVPSTSSTAPEGKPVPAPASEPTTSSTSPEPNTASEPTTSTTSSEPTTSSPSPSSSSISDSSSEEVTSSSAAQRQLASSTIQASTTSTSNPSSTAISSGTATATILAASTSAAVSTPSPSAPPKNGSGPKFSQPGSLMAAIAMLACAVPIFAV